MWVLFCSISGPLLTIQARLNSKGTKKWASFVIWGHCSGRLSCVYMWCCGRRKRKKSSGPFHWVGPTHLYISHQLPKKTTFLLPIVQLAHCQFNHWHQRSRKGLRRPSLSLNWSARPSDHIEPKHDLMVSIPGLWGHVKMSAKVIVKVLFL